MLIWVVVPLPVVGTWPCEDGPQVRCLYSHYFHMIGDGHQPDSRGLYTHYKDSYKRWDDLPQYREFRP